MRLTFHGGAGTATRFDFFRNFFTLKFNMRKISLKNLVWKEGKYYVAQCLNVDISSFGKTKKEALFNLDEALELYFEDFKKPRFAEVKKPEIVESSLGRA